MRIEQLEYLAAVTRHGSLRRASESLHLSQPALSEAVTKLERELRVTLLDRHRSGAQISREGRELLPYMEEVLAAVQRLRSAAGQHLSTGRPIRVGTVHAAISTLLLPAVRGFQEQHPGTTVNVLPTPQPQIDDGLAKGLLDLGLVNLLAGDQTPAGLTDTLLVNGRPVAVLPAGHPLTSQARVTVDDLRAQRFVTMRTGHVMHRFTQRLFADGPPQAVHATDGAEMAKALVAEGLGVTVLPDYSVDGDPLARAGLVERRPVAGDRTIVSLVLRERSTLQQPGPVRELRTSLVALAASYGTPRAS